MKKTAKFIKDVSEKWAGTAYLYQMTPAHETHKYCVVSQIIVLGMDETYIFGTNKNGKEVEWSELSGSFKGEMDHRKALEDAGYRIEGEKS